MTRKVILFLALPFLIDMLSGCTDKCPPRADYYFQYCSMDIELRDAQTNSLSVDSIAIDDISLGILFNTDLSQVCRAKTSDFSLNPLLALSCQTDFYHPSNRLDSLHILTLDTLNSTVLPLTMVNSMLVGRFSYSSIEEYVAELQEDEWYTTEALYSQWGFQSGLSIIPGLKRFRVIAFLQNGVQLESELTIPYVY